MNVENIIKMFCAQRAIEESSLERNDNRHINETKYMIWLYLHCEVGLSATQLAKRFKRNRPSIFRGIRIIKHCMKYSDSMAGQYHDIMAKIEGMTEATPSDDMERKEF